MNYRLLDNTHNSAEPFPSGLAPAPPILNRPEFCRSLEASYVRFNRSSYEQSTLPREELRRLKAELKRVTDAGTTRFPSIYASAAEAIQHAMALFPGARTVGAKPMRAYPAR